MSIMARLAVTYQAVPDSKYASNFDGFVNSRHLLVMANYFLTFSILVPISSHQK